MHVNLQREIVCAVDFIRNHLNIVLSQRKKLEFIVKKNLNNIKSFRLSELGVLGEREKDVFSQRSQIPQRKNNS